MDVYSHITNLSKEAIDVLFLTHPKEIYIFSLNIVIRKIRNCNRRYYT